MKQHKQLWDLISTEIEDLVDTPGLDPNYVTRNIIRIIKFKLINELYERLEKQKLIIYNLEQDTQHDRYEYAMMEGKKHLMLEFIKLYSPEEK